jgi:hypothetical protein
LRKKPKNKTIRDRRAVRASSAKRPPPSVAPSAARPATDDAPPAPTSPPLRSEGQRLLLAVSGSLASIAAAVGAGSKQSVSDWRTGKQVPSRETRAKLFAAYEIPPEAWALAPGTTAAPTPPSPAEVAAELAFDTAIAAAPSTLRDCLTLLAAVQAERAKPTLTPAERVKLSDTEARILALRHRLETKAEMIEDRIVREHPMWQRMKKTIVRALVKYPDAARAVVAAIREHEGEQFAERGVA